MEANLAAILKHILYVAVFIAGSVGLSTECFTIFTVLIIMDCITGIIRSAIFCGWRSITSARFYIGIVTKSIVIVVPLIVAWAGRGAGLDLLIMAKGILSTLILAEAYSVIGNIIAIRTGEDKEEFDAVASVLTAVRNQVKKLFINYRDKC